MKKIARFACVGGGVIGAGWVARLVLNGFDVAIYDPDKDAKAKVDAVLGNASRAYDMLTRVPRPANGAISYARSIGEAVAEVDLVIESVPERLDIKHKVYAEIEVAARRDAIIASSTSGIMPSDLQARLAHPDRLLVAHPFNPVYLLPLVEIVGGAQTSAETIARAMSFYTSIGMKPLHIRKEIEAFVADRLLEAVWREALWLVKDGIATTAEIDDAIRFGFGLRWAQMGMFETYRIAGGEAGMRHFMAQFGPCLTWPWTKLTNVPEFNDELVDLIAGQSDAQSGHRSIRELERIRDANLVAILQALKANDWGAGEALAGYEKNLMAAAGTRPAVADWSKPVATLERTVAPGWLDYNGHMNEACYLQCFSEATDAFLGMIGVNADYVASGGSYFTVETHIRHVAEAGAGEPIVVTTQLLSHAGKKLRLFNSMHHADGRLLATGEHMLLHVGLASRAASEPAPQIAAKLAEIAAGHARLPAPDGVGRAVGDPR